MTKAIYLDHAAATPLDPAVLKAMQPYFSDDFYNPSATYLASKKVAADITKTRDSVAQQLGARPSEIIFTAGGTEANNLAVQGVMQQFPKANLVISAIEHESIIRPAETYNSKLVKVSPKGVIDLKDLARKIDDQTVLVSIMYANNEIGTIQPIREVAKLVEQIRQKRKNKLPLYLHTDACQAANYLDLHVNRLGVDIMTLNGGKIYGPKQSGILYVKTGTQFKSQILGGGQENGRRSGTENVAGIIGFAKALDLAQSQRQTETDRLTHLQKNFIDQLAKKLPTAQINGNLEHRLPNNIHITIPGTDNERVMMKLDELGVMCAVGSACSASNEEPSHVLKAIGLSDQVAQSSLRFTLGRETRQIEIDETITAILASI